MVAETAADARDVMVEGESGLLAVHPQTSARSSRTLRLSASLKLTANIEVLTRSEVTALEGW